MQLFGRVLVALALGGPGLAKIAGLFLGYAIPYETNFGWLIVFLVCIELGLAIGIVANTPTIAPIYWLISLAFFFTFLYSQISEYFGTPTLRCDCFGGFDVPAGIRIATICLLCVGLILSFDRKWFNSELLSRFSVFIRSPNVIFVFVLAMLFSFAFGSQSGRTLLALPCPGVKFIDLKTGEQCKVLDLGRVSTGSRTTATLNLRNGGLSPVTLIGGGRICSCLTISDNPKILLPDKDYAITVRYTAPNEAGISENELDYFLDAVGQYRVSVLIRAEVGKD